MATFTGQNKSSDVTLTARVRAGQGWPYNDATLIYDGAIDPEGREVLYDSIGTSPTFTGQNKSSDVTLTAQNKS